MFDQIRIDISLDELYYVTPEDDEDDGERVKLVNHKRLLFTKRSDFISEETSDVILKRIKTILEKINEDLERSKT